MTPMLDVLGIEWINWYLDFYYSLKEPHPVKTPVFYYIVTGDATPIRKHYLKSARARAEEVERKLDDYRQADPANRNAEVIPHESVPHESIVTLERIWMGAAIAGDMELAKRITAPLAESPAAELDAPYAIRDVCLRHALAQDENAEAELIAKIKPGYMAGFPQPLIEFPLGVFKRDAGLVLEGMRKTNLRYKTKWDTKRWRIWFEKPGIRKPKTWEACLTESKKAMFNFNWDLARWALAWLNIAAWRSMDEVFESPKKFSQWMPIELARSGQR